MIGRGTRLCRALAVLGVLLAAGLLPTPAAADDNLVAVHYTCAGTAGVMADGRWTHVGAVGIFPAALSTYPYGTVLQDEDGRLWTVEDTGPNWPAYMNGRLRIDLYNYFTPGDCYRNFSVHDGWVRVRRYGWYGTWLP